MKTLAQRKGEKVFIVETIAPLGVVVNVDERLVSEEQKVVCFAKFGGWVAVEDQDAAAEAIVIVESGK